MKIGAWSFNDIVALGFDKARVAFTTGWLFAILVLSVASNLLVGTLLTANAAPIWITIVDVVSIVITILLALFSALAITASFKATAKSKAKTQSFIALAKPLFIKQLIVIVLMVLIAIAGVLVALAIGQIARIPVAGPVLIALLALPLVAGIAYILVFAAIATKLSAAAIVETNKATATEIIAKLLGLVRTQFAALTFNTILLLLPVLTIAVAGILILGLSYAGYILCGWALTGSYMTLALSMQGGANAIYILQTLAGLGVFAYLLSYILNVTLAGFYSIYLDAAK